MKLSPSASSSRSSPLMLSDSLLKLAEEADRAGCAITAEHLLALAHTVFEDAAPCAPPPRRRAGLNLGLRPMGAPPAIFAHLPAPVSGLAMRAGR